MSDLDPADNPSSRRVGWQTSLVVLLLLAGPLPLACGSEDRKVRVRQEGGAGGEGGALEPTSAAGREGDSGGLAGASAQGGAGSQSALALADYCGAVVELYHDFLVTCYGATDFPASGRDAYVARSLGRCLEVAPSVDDGRLAFDGVAAAACIAELEAADDCSSFDFLMRAPACTALFSARTAVGEACYRDATLHFTVTGASSECHQGFCAGDQCPGACQAWLEEGETCEAAQCAPELFCIDGVCAPRPGEGEDCSQEDACEAGLACVEGTCRQPSRAGDPCYGEVCSSGFNCIEGVCGTKVEAGEACTWRYDCRSDGRCLDRDGDGPEGPTCGPLGVLGDSCREPLDCGPNFYCEREPQMVGTCESRLPISAECKPGSCEAGAWCNYFTGFCQARGEAGDDCMAGTAPGPNEACAPGLFCMSSGQCHPIGEVGDPCHVRQAASCVEGSFCSRDGAVCAELGGMGDYCNPFLPQPCAGDLGCVCAGADCAITTPTDEHDTRFVCGPRPQVGDECFGEFECAGDAYCAFDDPRTCQAPALCVP